MGAGLGKMIAGGAIGGFGEGLVGRAEHKRKRALQMLEEQARAARDRADREFRGGLIQTTKTDEDGKVWGVAADPSKKPVDLGITERKSARYLYEERKAGEGGSGTDDEGLSADEKRDWDTTVGRFTEGYLDTKEVNWTKVEAYFRKKGNDKLADKAASNDAGPAIDTSPGSVAYKEADQQATTIANERKGLLKSREKEFPETKGSEQEFINMKRTDILRQLETGQESTPQTPAPEAPAEPEGQTSGFKSREEVGEAYQAGKITLEEARRILAEEFGGQ